MSEADPSTPNLPNSCPVLHDAQLVLEASHDLNKAMDRLRRSRRKCRTCDMHGHCPAWQAFNRQVQQAILEVNRAWKID
jgi:hypothetical protein